ncbi:hypothetical protein ACWCOP_03125 [Maricaulaceae bacterium MS644]
MTHRPVQPTDLLIAPDDPFEALEGYDPSWPYRSVSLTDPRIYVVRLLRTQARDTAENAALGLGQRLADGYYKGLILDYRQAEIDHGPDNFAAIADAFAGAFPAGMPMVYLHDGATFVFARLMVQLLRDRGVRAARASAFAPAWEAIIRTA